MNLESSSATIIFCICLVVCLSFLNPYGLMWRIWCFMPYVDRTKVRVLVEKSYIVFAKDIGLWLDSSIGSPFYIVKL